MSATARPLDLAFIASNQGAAGGGEYLFVLLAIGLRDRGHRVRYLCSTDAGMDRWAELLQRCGVVVERRPMRSYLALPGRVVQAGWDRLTAIAVREFLRGPVDAVHINQQNAEDAFNVLPAACGLRPGRVVSTIHNPHPLGLYGSRFAGLRSWWTRRLHRRHRFLRTVVAEAGIGTFSSWIPDASGGLAAVPNGVPDHAWLAAHGLASAGDDGGLGARLDGWRAAGDVLIGMACRLTAQKDVPCALRALALVRRTHPRAVLVIGGGGPERGGLERQAAALGLGDGVRWLGSLSPSAMDAFYARLRLFVLSSRWEGLPLTLLESLRRGVPVVSAAVDGCVEVLRDRPRLGRLTAAGDSAALAAGIRSVLDDASIAVACAVEGPELCARSYSIGSMVDGYERIYRRLVSDGDAGAPAAT